METKLSKLKAAFDAGDLQGAIRIAARFPQLGEHRDDIMRAHGAYTNPNFYKQLGYDTEALKEKGRQALIAKYYKREKGA